MLLRFAPLIERNFLPHRGTGSQCLNIALQVVGTVRIGTGVDQISQCVEVLPVGSALENSSFVRDFGLPPWYAVLGYYAAHGCHFLPKFRDNLSKWSR